ncbi:MAG: recombination protein RecR [Opitutales bacterium]|nr:recombination protein RecR [Opitutales bacterium]
MSGAFENLCAVFARLPGMGRKSAERAALHLAFSDRAHAGAMIESLKNALETLTPCPKCRGISENGRLCEICSDTSRNLSSVCLVESASDMAAIEKSGAWRGSYHVLGGKLSPIKNITPADLNFKELEARAESGEISEIVLALSNDIEGEATCHYIAQKIALPRGISVSRIGFGLPSGSQLGFADTGTIKSALAARKNF